MKLVSFDIPKIPTSAADKAKVTKYYNYLKGTKGEAGISSGVRVKVRRKDPEKLAKLQRELGQGKLTGIKYAFVPSMIDPKTGFTVKVHVRSNKVAPDVIRIRPINYLTGKPSGEISFQFEPLNHAALLHDPVAEIERVIMELKSRVDGDEPQRFRVRANDRTVTDVDFDDTITDRVMFYMSEYKLTWRQWLSGITMETAGKQTTLQAYHRARVVDKERKKAVRKISKSYVSVLNAIESSLQTDTRTLTQRAYGVQEDRGATKTIKDMLRKGLISGNDSAWRMTREGQKYLKFGREHIQYFK